MNPKAFADEKSTRRSFLVGIGSVASTVGIPIAATADDVYVTPPSIPKRFEEDSPWVFEDLEPVKNNTSGYEYAGSRGSNTEARDEVKKATGIDHPMWDVYTFEIRELPSASSDAGLIGGLIDKIAATLGPISVEFDLEELPNLFGDDKSFIGTAAFDVFVEKIQSNHEIKSIDKRCDGLHEDTRFFDLTCSEERDYDNTSGSDPELFSVILSEEIGEYVIEYAAILSVQSYNNGDTFIAAGAIYPTTFDNGPWGDSTIEFSEIINEDPFHTSTELMKGTR